MLTAIAVLGALAVLTPVGAVAGAFVVMARGPEGADLRWSRDLRAEDAIRSLPRAS